MANLKKAIVKMPFGSSKIDFVDGFLLLSVSGISDTIEFFAAFTGVGIFVSEFMNLTVEAVNGTYLFFKGVNGVTQWGTFWTGAGSDAISGAALPGKTIALAVNIYLHNKMMDESETNDGDNEDAENPDGDIKSIAPDQEQTDMQPAQ